MAFLAAVVGLVDSTGKRIDPPDADGNYQPILIEVGDGISAVATRNGGTTTVALSVTPTADDDTPQPEWFMSPVDILSAGFGQTTANPGASYTVGIWFVAMRSCICTGVRFFWTGSVDVKASLWTVDDLASVADVTITTGIGVNEATFDPPVTLETGREYYVSCWQTDGLAYVSCSTGIVSDLPAAGSIIGSHIAYRSFSQYNNAGDGVPSGGPLGGSYFAVEPILRNS